MHTSLSFFLLAALSAPSLARLDRREARPAMLPVVAVTQIGDGQIQVLGPGVTESRNIVTPVTSTSTTPAAASATSSTSSTISIPDPLLRVAPDVPSLANNKSSTPTTVAPIATVAPPAGAPIAAPIISSVAPAIVPPAETRVAAPAAPVTSSVPSAVPSIDSSTIMAPGFNASMPATKLATFSTSLVSANSTSSRSNISSAAATSTYTSSSTLPSSSTTAAATAAAGFTGDGERMRVGMAMGVLVAGAVGAMLR